MRFEAILTGLDHAQRLEVLALVDPSGIWPSCLAEPRKRFDAERAAAAEAAAKPARRAAHAAKLAELKERFDTVSSSIADPGKLSQVPKPFRTLFESVRRRLTDGQVDHAEEDLGKLERIIAPLAKAIA